MGQAGETGQDDHAGVLQLMARNGVIAGSASIVIQERGAVACWASLLA